MALTKRFYNALAADFKGVRPEQGTPEREVWASMIVVVASNLAVNNAMFNFQRFYEACGMDLAGAAY